MITCVAGLVPSGEVGVAGTATSWKLYTQLHGLSTAE